MADVPFQSHSSTSIEASEKLDPERARTQEQWVYEARIQSGLGNME